VHTVGLIVFDRIPTFEMAVPCEVFGTDRSGAGLPKYRLLVCVAEPGPLRAGDGFAIEAPFGLSDLRKADTVIVPAWRDPDEVPPKALLDALRQSYRRGARVATLCMGAFVLAYAGLLDGRLAVTHWVHADALAGRFPAVEVDADVLYVDEWRVLTSAGTAAGIDLCLHMVRQDHGAKVANEFARRMVVSPHRDGGQFSVRSGAGGGETRRRTAGGDPGVGVRQPGRAPHGEAPVHARPHVREDLRTPLPGGHRDHTLTVAARPEDPRRPEPAGDLRRPCRPDRPRLRLRHGGHPPPALQAGGGRLPDRLSQGVWAGTPTPPGLS
jgi:putative intracellular protease/amidase